MAKYNSDFKLIEGDDKPQQTRRPMGDFEELSVSEIEMLSPLDRQEYLRRKAARGAMGVEQALSEGAGAAAAEAKRMPAAMRSQLATSMMGLTGGGLAQGLASMGQMAKTVTPAATLATIQGQQEAAKLKADARAAGVEGASFLAEQGVGALGNVKDVITGRVESMKAQKRNSILGLDADDVYDSIIAMKQSYTDDNGNIDPEIDRYIDELAEKEREKAEGWDIW